MDLLAAIRRLFQKPDATTEPLAVEPTPVATPAAIEAPVAVDVQVVRSEPAPQETGELSTTLEPEGARDEPAVRQARDGVSLVLRLETEGGAPPTFEIAKTGAVVGRGEESGVRLNDLSVSRRHARIAFRQGGFWISDLGSTSGTWVDGVRLAAPHRVAAGEVIDVGVCRLTVVELHERIAAAPRRRVPHSSND